METETANLFLEYRQGRNVFRFLCPTCGAWGELGVPDGHDRNRLVSCPDACGAYFIVRRSRGLFTKPVLEYAFGAAPKAA